MNKFAKKISVLAVAMLMSASTAALAQSLEDMEASKAAIEQLLKENKPAATGMGNIDKLVEEAVADATNSMAVTNSVYALYVKTFHPQAGEGTPTMDDCTALTETVQAQIKDLDDVPGMTAKAGEDLGNAKVLAKPKCLAAMNFAKKVYGVLTNELQLQAKVLNAVSQKLSAKDE